MISYTEKEEVSINPIYTLMISSFKVDMRHQVVRSFHEFDLHKRAHTKSIKIRKKERKRKPHWLMLRNIID